MHCDMLKCQKSEGPTSIIVELLKRDGYATFDLKFPCSVQTYVLWSHWKDVGTFQNLDLLALRVGRHRRRGVHRRLPGSARHPRAALVHTPAGSSD